MEFIGRAKISQFIANNLNIEFMASTVSDKEPFGIILKPLVFEFPNLFQKFKQQLYDEVKKCTKEQMYAVKVTLEDEFLPTINGYLKWYEENKKLTKKYFPKQDPYFFVNDDVKLFKREILKYFPEIEKSIEDKPIRTKADILQENLQIVGFYNLNKVKKLSETGQKKLIKLISQSMAYGIAMFDYLGFCTFLDNEKGAKYKANHYLSRLYNEKVKDGTQAKHYRNSLVNNKPRYTSYLHKEKVKKDYEQLK